MAIQIEWSAKNARIDDAIGWIGGSDDAILAAGLSRFAIAFCSLRHTLDERSMRGQLIGARGNCVKLPGRYLLVFMLFRRRDDASLATAHFAYSAFPI